MLDQGELNSLKRVQKLESTVSIYQQQVAAVGQQLVRYARVCMFCVVLFVVADSAFFLFCERKNFVAVILCPQSLELCIIRATTHYTISWKAYLC